jgi:ubiquinone biosynthesis protein
LSAIIERHRKHGATPVAEPADPATRIETGPARLRAALEELGPTFIKLGQMLATRPDVLPPAYVTELARLQDETTPVPFADLSAVIRSELGADPAELYGSIEETPLAVASIGQAHRATLKDGSPVVVKIRKPGVSRYVEQDLAILDELVEVAAREWQWVQDFGIPALLDSFSRTLRAELDYRSEVEHAERFRQNLADDPVVHIPVIHEDLSSSRVLTEQFASGMRIDDTAALDAAGVDRSALADAATRTVLQMVLVDGFFHADPHPGNLFVREDHGLWLIDFGMVGELDDDLRGHIMLLVLALQTSDADMVLRRLLKIAPARGTIDRRRLRSDVVHLMETVGGDSFAEMSMVDFFKQLTSMVRRHRLELPGEVSTLLRMLVLTESSAVVLDPGFHLGQVLSEVGSEALLANLGPQAVAKRLGKGGLQATQLALDLPDRALRLLDDYEARGIEVRLNTEDLEPLVERIESTADRMIAGITMSALIVGVSGVVARGVGRAGRWQGPLTAAAGAGAGLLGTYVLAGAGVARSGRRFVKKLRG